MGGQDPSLQDTQGGADLHIQEDYICSAKGPSERSELDQALDDFLEKDNLRFEDDECEIISTDNTAQVDFIAGSEVVKGETLDSRMVSTDKSDTLIEPKNDETKSVRQVQGETSSEQAFTGQEHTEEEDGAPEHTEDGEEQDPEEMPDKAKVARGEIFDWFDSLVFSVVTVVLVLSFVFRIVGVDGISMTPTLIDFDRVIMWELGYTPEVGDVVVVTKLESPLVKRIIAMEGQTVDIDFNQGIVYVDGRALDEPYINEPTYRSEDIIFPLVVPQGHVFVMGDNRNYSSDSRSSIVGFIDERYILGKVVLRVLPMSEFGFIS